MSAKFDGHTRGPWYVNYRGPGYGYGVYADGSNSLLCGRIDAALMAAAPELLAENERLRARVAELEAAITED